MRVTLLSAQPTTVMVDVGTSRFSTWTHSLSLSPYIYAKAKKKKRHLLEGLLCKEIDIILVLKVKKKKRGPCLQEAQRQVLLQGLWWVPGVK